MHVGADTDRTSARLPLPPSIGIETAAASGIAALFAETGGGSGGEGAEG